jgi:hypothetical protein
MFMDILSTRQAERRSRIEYLARCRRSCGRAIAGILEDDGNGNPVCGRTVGCETDKPRVR